MTHLSRPASLLLLLVLACNGGGGGTTETDSGQDPSTSTSTTETMGQVPSTSTDAESITASTTDPGTPTSTGEPTTAGTTDTTTGGAAPIVVEGLSHPESIIHDAAADVYLISNIHGDPTATDDNGFIARVLPDGTIEDMAFIDGAAGDFTLDAPKGMAIVGDALYVTDITVVRKFDRVSGAHVADIPVDGASFLNDLSADAAGDVYVSDMLGQAIHVISPDDAVTLLLESPDLADPNGLVADDGGVHVATNNATWLLYVPREMPAVMELVDLPGSGLDGLAVAPGGDLLVTSWETSSLYRISADLTVAGLAIADLPSPADIGVDAGRNRVLVPLLLEDRAEFHDL